MRSPESGPHDRQGDEAMRNSTMTHALALGVAGAIALSAATPSMAAPVLSSTTAVQAATSSDVTQVRWRGRGAAVGVGLAAGALLGAAAAASAYNYSYYPYYYGGYGGPYYAYAPAPAYVYEPAPTYYYGRPYGYGSYYYGAPYPSNPCQLDAYGRVEDYDRC
jgi:hypothetical protein